HADLEPAAAHALPQFSVDRIRRTLVVHFSRLFADHRAGANLTVEMMITRRGNKKLPQRASVVSPNAGGSCASAAAPRAFVARTSRPNASTIAEIPPEAARAIGSPSSIARYRAMA